MMSEEEINNYPNYPNNSYRTPGEQKSGSDERHV